MTKTIQSMALFMVFLVITLPIYASSALAASVEITHNSGDANIPDYIDASGDTWQVDVQISGNSEPVSPDNVLMTVESGTEHFDSCNPSDLGTVCTYQSPLTGIDERSYEFVVDYAGSSDVGIIYADSSAPQITFSGRQAWQESGVLHLDFSVSDQLNSRPCVGIDTIEIVDASSQQVLQTIPFTEKMCDYNFMEDSRYLGQVQSSLTGEGFRLLKVRATDKLGHQSTSQVVATETDFVAPQILMDTLNLSIGKFMGQFITSANMQVDIIERNTIDASSITVISPDVEVLSDAQCVAGEEDLWHCSWDLININPTSSLTMALEVTDEYGNVATESKIFSLTLDSTAPTIIFFGTDKVYNEQSYTHNDPNRVILQAEDQGSGVTVDQIRANLVSIGGSTQEIPTCENNLGLVTCVWDVNTLSAGSTPRIWLTEFEDAVGNEGELRQIELVNEDDGPIVKELRFRGSTLGLDHDYFQDNDEIHVTATLQESSGVIFLINLNNVVMDAPTLYPTESLRSGVPEREGWAVFKSEDVCERGENDLWECSFFTDPIKSGPASSVDLFMRVLDTAGNDAQIVEAWETEPKFVTGTRGDYEFDILGTELQENPNYWEVRPAPVPIKKFIDLDVTNLGYMTMPFTVQLRSGSDNAEALSVTLIPNSCQPVDAELPAPTLSRALVQGGNYPSGVDTAEMVAVLEFTPFQGRSFFGISKDDGEFEKVTVDYNCQFRVLSKVGDVAITTPEIQDVTFSVDFSFSKLGAADEKLEEKIKEKRDEIETGFYGVLGVLAEIFKWVDYLVQVVQLVIGAMNLVNSANAAMQPVSTSGFGKPAAIATCLGINNLEQAVDTGIAPIDTAMQILSCRPAAGNLGWYGRWQNMILNFYRNAETLQQVEQRQVCYDEENKPISCPITAPARDIKENLYLSALGLCVPGIIENMEELRQIKCRTLYCYEEEVPANIATIDSCDKLESLLKCKFFYGELWYILPFSQAWDNIWSSLQRAIADPLAVAHTVSLGICGTLCLTGENGLSAGCSLTYYIWDVIGYVEQIAGFFTTLVGEFEEGGSNYCSAVL
ncbi:hypothetical protein HOC32_00540 [Candidatus Woesearchaeota archaeon]|nr:hypothetical protein [Candidatus Woesearchaeota archaeon]